MTDRHRMQLSIATMAVVAIGAVAVTVVVMYTAAFNEQRARLMDIVSMQARFISSVTGTVAEGEDPRAGLEVGLEKVARAHASFCGFSGPELRVVERKGEAIVSPVDLRFAKAPPLRPIPWNSTVAEPMRLALSGGSGTVLSRDEAGRKLLAAYYPVGDYGLGIVATIDLAELRAPFVRAGIGATAMALVLLVFGTAVLGRVGLAVVRHGEISQQELRSLFDSSAVGVVVYGDEVVEDCNEEMCRCLGRARAELVGRDPGDFFPLLQADGSPSAESWGKKLVAATLGQEQSFSWRYERGDGTILDADVQLRPVSLDEGTRVMATVRDVTDELLRQDRVEQLSRAVEQSPVSVVITDLEGKVEYVNPQFSAVSGYTLASVQGGPPHFMSAENIGPGMHKALWAALDAGREWRAEFLSRRSSGESYWEAVSVGPVSNEAGETTHYLAISEDVTDRKRSEQALLDLNSELEKRVSLRTEDLRRTIRDLESFTSAVSHDLRQPLHTTGGFLSLLRKKLDNQLDPRSQDYLERACGGITAMSAMIDALLQLSRVSRTEPSPVELDLSALAEEVARKLRESAPEREVEFVIQPDLKVFGDEKLLTVLLEHLLGNAYKFTRKRQAARIELGAEDTSGGRRVYAVRDNGVGFSMSYAGKLFTTLGRLHSSEDFEGSGVGLVTAARVVERHGGEIWCDATEESGAAFYFTLGKVAAAQGRPSQEPDGQASQPDGQA